MRCVFGAHPEGHQPLFAVRGVQCCESEDIDVTPAVVKVSKQDSHADAIGPQFDPGAARPQRQQRHGKSSAAAQDAERNHPSGFVAIAANPLQSQHQQGGAAQYHQQPGDVIKCNCGCECAQVCTPVPV